MKKDLKLINSILQRFIDAPTSFIRFHELDGRDPDEFLNDETFIQHLLIVFESELISNRYLETKPLTKLGLHVERSCYGYSDVELRLTSEGYALAESLSKTPILEQLQEQAASAPFNMIITLSKKLLEKKLTDSLGL